MEEMTVTRKIMKQFERHIQKKGPKGIISNVGKATYANRFFLEFKLKIGNGYVILRMIFSLTEEFPQKKPRCWFDPNVAVPFHSFVFQKKMTNVFEGYFFSSLVEENWIYCEREGEEYKSLLSIIKEFITRWEEYDFPVGCNQVVKFQQSDFSEFFDKYQEIIENKKEEYDKRKLESLKKLPLVVGDVETVEKSPKNISIFKRFFNLFK